MYKEVPLIRIPSKEHAQNYLSKLSSSPHDSETARNGIQQHGLIRGLIQMLRSGSATEISQAATLETITEVAKSDFERQIQLSNALPQVVDTMSYSSSPRLREASVIAVSALCENNEQTIKMLMKTKAFNEVIAWIQQNHSPDLIRIGCLFVESLCNNGKRADMQTLFQRKGALKIISDHLKKPNDDLVTCGLALAGAALVKCIHDENQRKFRRLKLLPRLIGLLIESGTKQMQIEAITTFILELVRGCKKNCKSLASNGLIQILLPIMTLEATPLTIFNCQGIIWFCIRSDSTIRNGFLQLGLVAKLRLQLTCQQKLLQNGAEKLLNELNVPLHIEP